MRRFLKYWLLLLIWLGVMFGASTNLLSSEHTSRYIVPFLLWLKPGASPNTTYMVSVVVRKCAHVIEYAILALLLWRLLHSRPSLRTRNTICFGAVLLGCALFAISDEFHQTFVKSRTPSVRDVCLDMTGALVGVLIAASFTGRRANERRLTIQRQFMDAQL
ncbi:MAG TPA: VanZ family protein [Candidatus Udaeobacter sp.]|jgi:VanZ family protein|nr:VanZ family protein [Candidatus Udaeobacter sp.]